MYEVLQVVEMAVLFGGSAASDLGCGFLTGLGLGLGISGLFGCGPCGIAGVVVGVADWYLCT